jgi:hypothetical protein
VINEHQRDREEAQRNKLVTEGRLFKKKRFDLDPSHATEVQAGTRTSGLNAKSIGRCVRSDH